MSNTQETDIQTKIYNLVIELATAEKEKKASAKMQSENVKRIKEEIKAILDEEDEAVKASQQEVE